MNISLLEWPDEAAWISVKQRALITIGKNPISVPDMEWRKKILRARHSPVRYLRFSFLIQDIPYWVACELRTHVHDMPYVADFGVYIKSQRSDRQDKYDRGEAKQSAPVNMLVDINGEQIQILANKRLCQQATHEAREVVKTMCWLVEEKCPEYKGLLVPMCVHNGGVCHEIYPCKK